MVWNGVVFRGWNQVDQNYRDDRGPRVDPQLLVNVFEMTFDGEIADEELFPNRLVGVAAAEALDHVDFTIGQVESRLHGGHIDHPAVAGSGPRDPTGLTTQAPLFERQPDGADQLGKVIL